MPVSRILEHPGDRSRYYDSTKRYKLQGGIFVFGSNLAGRHGKGAALEAHETYFARKGVGVGFTGQSYAIPTKDGNLNVLSIEEINKHVQNFRWCAEICDIDGIQRWFYVTPIGTGLAGYPHEVIAPLFSGTINCWFPDIWKPYLGEDPSFYRKTENNAS